MRPLAAALFALAAAACASYERGVLAAAALEPLPLSTQVVAQAVEGRSCGIDGRYERALEDALLQAPGAEALADVTYSFERLCLVVRGTAVRLD